MLRFLPVTSGIKNSGHFVFAKQRSNPLTRFRFLSQETQEKSNLCNDSSSLTVSYLINSCELSPKSALSASKKITINTTKKPGLVFDVFKSYGFTNTQITKLITKHPQFLSSNPERTIKPKLNYFLDVGFSVTEVAHLVSSDPVLLLPSLEKRLKPNFELLGSIIGNTQQMAAAISRSSWLLTNNLETNFLPNVRVLQSYGVPDPKIAKLVTLYPRSVTQATKQFAAVVDAVKKYGFNTLSTTFVQGVNVMAALSTSSWERKVALYKSLGWSEGEVISAFTKQPFCMMLSEENIRRKMDLYAKKLQWGPSFLAAHPMLLYLSLEKRVIPRCLVMSILASKGLVRGFPSVGYQFLLISEKHFLRKYVIKYQGQVPELPEAYKGDLEPMGFEGDR